MLRELIGSYRRARTEHGHDHGDDDVTVLTPLFTHADPAAGARSSSSPASSGWPSRIRQRAATTARRPFRPEPAPRPNERRAERLAQQLDGFGYDVLVEREMAVFGTPADAAGRIRRLADELTAGRVICWFDPGGLAAHDDIVSSMTAFADVAGCRS